MSKIESANKFQHGLWHFFSNLPTYALCSFFLENITFLAQDQTLPWSVIVLRNPLTWERTALVWHECKISFRDSCAKLLQRSSGRRATICKNGNLWVHVLHENGFPENMCWPICAKFPMYLQWEFQDPKTEVLYHIRPFFCGDIPLHRPYIGLT